MIVKDHKRILKEEKQEEKKENINTDIPKDFNPDMFKDSTFLWLLLLYAFTTGFGGSNNVSPYFMQPPTNVNIYIDSKKESCKCEQN